jgi:hypothetical protein
MCCCKLVIIGMWLLTTIPISHDTLQDEYPDVRTLRRPGLCLGIRRMVRSISASMVPMVQPRSATISLNSSQNGLSTVIDEERPLILTNLACGDWKRFLICNRIVPCLADRYQQMPKLRLTAA